MKTIENILNRTEYKALAEQMRGRVQFLAKIIRSKMSEIEESQIYADGFGVEIKYAGRYSYLATGLGTKKFSLEDCGRRYFVNGDPDYKVEGADDALALRFLNNARTIIEALGEEEEKKVQAIQKALDETSGLVETEA